jgi:hypothetical protein
MEKILIIEKIISKVKKSLINERKSDELSLQISRLIINKFKKKENFEFEGIYFERGNDYASFDLKCKFISDKNMDEPFSIHAEADMQVMEIEITYDPKSFPESMNDLVAEIKETVEHELEHIEQQNFEDMEVEDDEDIDSNDPDHNFKYLKSNVEVPAYVRGLIKRSKTKKTSLDDAMEEWFKENMKKFKNPKDEWPIIKDIWKKYANEMRNSERVKKFK